MLAYALASAGDVAFDHDHPRRRTAPRRGPMRSSTDASTRDRRAATSPGSRPATVGADRPRRRRLVDELTDRELAVLRYLPSQLSQREIASELYVSLNTVKTHCKAIYRKLGVDGRKAAVQAAREHNLL